VITLARKLSDADVTRVRELGTEGLTQSEIAAQFDVGRRQVGRILSGGSRPQLAGLDRDIVDSGNVLLAVDQFLTGIRLDDANEVTAAVARNLASQLDGTAAKGSAAGAAAAPRIAVELAAAITDLRGTVREPDGLDALKAKRAARLLAQAAAPTG
jgi:transcriptional regulator with XRE-family HTH domain